MARKMTPTERAARDAMAPYVRAGEMTQGEANKTVRFGLAAIEEAVRSNLAANFGSAFYYGAKVTSAREEWSAARGMTSRHMKRVRVVATEITLAVYMSVREEYKSPTDIRQEDVETPALAAALGVVREESRTATATARQTAA